MKKIVVKKQKVESRKKEDIVKTWRRKTRNVETKILMEAENRSQHVEVKKRKFRRREVGEKVNGRKSKVKRIKEQLQIRN